MRKVVFADKIERFLDELLANLDTSFSIVKSKIKSNIVVFNMTIL